MATDSKVHVRLGNGLNPPTYALCGATGVTTVGMTAVTMATCRPCIESALSHAGVCCNPSCKQAAQNWANKAS